MIVLCAGMNEINNAVHDFIHRKERKGRKDGLIGLYAINHREHREKWQSNSIPAMVYEKAAASRFRTRMTRIARIFADILDQFATLFHSTDNKPQRSQRAQSRMGKLCALRVLCDGLALFSALLTRIYPYPRVSASSAQSAFHRRLSAFIMPKPCGFSTPRTRMPAGIRGHALQRRDSGRHHLRLIYDSLSDRTRKIQFEQFIMMRKFLLFPGFSKQNIIKSPWRGEL